MWKRRGRNEGRGERKKTHLHEPIETESRPLVDVPLDPLCRVLTADAVLGELDEKEAVLVFRERLALGLVRIDDLELLERVLDLGNLAPDGVGEAVIVLAASVGDVELLDLSSVVCGGRVEYRRVEKGRKQRTLDFSVAVPEHSGVLLDLVDGLGRDFALNVVELVAAEWEGLVVQYGNEPRLSGRKRDAPAVLLHPLDERQVLPLVPVAEAETGELLLLRLLLLRQVDGVVDLLLLGSAFGLELLSGGRVGGARRDLADLGDFALRFLRKQRGSATSEGEKGRGRKVDEREGRAAPSPEFPAGGAGRT